MLKIFYLLFLMQIFVVNGDSGEDVEVIIPDDKHVERPCKFEDMDCIKKLFRRKGWCDDIKPKIKKQPADKPYQIPGDVTAEVPAVNSTLCQKDVTVLGLGAGKVVELYINKKTDRAVLAVYHKKVTVNSSVVIYYNRPRKEPIIIKSDAYEVHKSLTITTVGEQMKTDPKYYPTIYMQNKPEFQMDDTDNIKNKEVLRLLQAMKEKLTVTAAEAFHVRSPCFSAFYVQNVICSRHK